MHIICSFLFYLCQDGNSSKLQNTFESNPWKLKLVLNSFCFAAAFRDYRTILSLNIFLYFCWEIGTWISSHGWPEEEKPNLNPDFTKLFWYFFIICVRPYVCLFFFFFFFLSSCFHNFSQSCKSGISQKALQRKFSSRTK